MDAHLKTLSFWIAAVGGCIALGVIVEPALRPIVVPAMVVTGGTAAALFFRLALSRTYREGLNAANAEIGPSLSRVEQLRDPRRGVFGRDWGSPALLWLRAVLIAGWCPIALAQHAIDWPPTLLWFFAGSISISLSQMNLVDSRKSALAAC